MAENSSNQGLSNDTKTLIVVLTLIFVYPVGLILMFMWMKWKTWVKILVAFPVTIFLLIFVVGFIMAAVNPAAQVKKAECARACDDQGLVGAEKADCTENCLVLEYE